MGGGKTGGISGAPIGLALLTVLRKCPTQEIAKAVERKQEVWVTPISRQGSVPGPQPSDPVMDKGMVVELAA